jgi:hypothetical protein
VSIVDRPYETDPDGLLYEPGIRDSLRTALPDDGLLGVRLDLHVRLALDAADGFAAGCAVYQSPWDRGGLRYAA